MPDRYWTMIGINLAKIRLWEELGKQTEEAEHTAVETGINHQRVNVREKAVLNVGIQPCFPRFVEVPPVIAIGNRSC